VHSAPFLPLKDCVNAPSSKCRFMECVGDSVFVVDLGMFSVFLSMYCCADAVMCIAADGDRW